MFVGDRPFDDIHGAAQVGMRTILIPHSEIPTEQHGPVTGEPDATVQRLADVLACRRQLALTAGCTRSASDVGASLIIMLVRVLRTYLRPYRRWLSYVVGLQLISTLAALYLPSLNADIIDNGVATRRHRLHRARRRLDARRQPRPDRARRSSRSTSARAPRCRSDATCAPSLFSRVGTFSAREIAHFGAPSLITRNTNDVQQVQMLVVMACTLMIGAPIMCVGGIIMALREDLGMSWLLGVSVPVLAIAIGMIVTRMVPQFRTMQVRIDTVNRVLREQIGGIRVVRAFVREPRGAGALRPARTTS